MTIDVSLSPIEILNAARPDSPPVNVDDLAQRLRLRVQYTSDLPPSIAGAILKDRVAGAPGYFIRINANDNPRRRRFTLAHEIAHYILHRDLIGDGITDDAMYRSPLGDTYERQANRMAADILMPPQLVRAVYKVIKAFAPLADAFDVSVDAMRIRLKELNLG